MEDRIRTAISNKRAIAALIASVSTFSVTLGLTYPLLTLKLSELGVANDMIGVNAAMTPLGMMASALFVPRIAERVRTDALLVSAAVTTAGCLAAIAAWPDPWVWLGLRFVFGCSVTVLFVVGESGLVALTHSSNRGRVVGLYSGIVAAGYGAGPLLLWAVGADTTIGLFIAIAICLAAAAPILVSQLDTREPAETAKTTLSPVKFILWSPFLLVACGAVAVFDNASMALFPLYALERGIDAERGSFLLGALMIGGIALQYPVGTLADRIGRRLTMGTCGVLTVLGCVAVGILPLNHVSAPVVMFLLGGISFGIYTVALTELGDRFAGQLLVAGNSMMTVAWGAASVGGVSIAGLMMNNFGPDWLLLALATLPFVTVVLVCLRIR